VLYISGRRNGRPKSHVPDGGGGDARYLHRHRFPLIINLFSIYCLIVSGVMLRSNIFGRVTAYLEIPAAIFNWTLYVPTIGLFLSMLSVFPFLAIWSILVARRLFQLGRAS